MDCFSKAPAPLRFTLALRIRAKADIRLVYARQNPLLRGASHVRKTLAEMVMHIL